MKILQLIHKLQNRGAETFACQLSNHLIALGHEIKIVAVFKGEAIMPYKGKIICLDASPTNRFFDFGAWKRLAVIIDNFRPDIVQANAGDTLKYAVFSKLIFRWKVPVVFRNASEIGRYLKSKFQKSYNSFLYSNIDLVVSVSRVSENDILQHFPFLKGKTMVIPIGLEEIDQILPIDLQPSSVKHLAHIGGFTFEKNHIGLLRILQIILKSDERVHLHLVGDGPLKREVELEVEKRGLKTNVSFYGFVNNPLSFISSADVLVLPSIIEGLPGVILEAMYCETPVVAYNVGGISEILDEGTGYLVEKNDETAFANIVLSILSDPDDSRNLTANKLVRDEFMNAEIALKFVNSYQKLVDGEE